MKKRAATILSICILCCLIPGVGLSGCHSSSSSNQGTADKVAAQSTEKSASTSKHKTYSDIPTLYPNLYSHDSEHGSLNVYDEAKVIDYSEAGNYVGQTVTVEGVADSVVHASSSSGSPYFINFGSNEFVIVIWSEDVGNFDQHQLSEYVKWSMSDQPISATFRVSGTVGTYEGKPEIVARDGSQIATQMADGTWFTMMSDAATEALMDSLYK